MTLVAVATSASISGAAAAAAANFPAANSRDADVSTRMCCLSLSRFAGSHTVVSGWTCAVLAETLDDISSGRHPPSTSAWARFFKLAQGNDKLLASKLKGDPDLPAMLFAGRLLDCPSASVYQLPSSPREVDDAKTRLLPGGLMIVNDYESVDD